MSTILKTYNLTKKYGGKKVVDHMNLTIEKGDIYGLIGRNGAGKTTFMKLILGLTIKNGGKIELFESKKLSKGRKKVGSLIEDAGLFKNYSARENMRRFAIMTGSGSKEIEECLELVGLKDVGNKQVGKFSLGMRQRLGLAIAMLGQPEFMVLDEPVNGLDPEGIRDIRDIIVKLNREKGVTFLISSHLIDELSKIATKYGIVSNGVLIEEFTSSSIENAGSTGTYFVVNDVYSAMALIRRSVPGMKVTNEDGKIFVNTIKYASDINSLLVRNGFSVSEVSRKSVDLEDYILRRMS